MLFCCCHEINFVSGTLFLLLSQVLPLFQSRWWFIFNLLAKTSWCNWKVRPILIFSTTFFETLYCSFSQKLNQIINHYCQSELLIFLFMFYSMLSGSGVTTAWRVLRLQMEEKASRYGGQLRIYWISSRGQPTRGGSPAWGLGGG
jgi:hypothetical protein